MLDHLFIALLKDFIVFLKLKPTFFELNIQDRTQTLKNAQIWFSQSIHDYLLHISEIHFQKDLKAFLKYLKENHLEQIAHKDSLFSALENFFVKEFALNLDAPEKNDLNHKGYFLAAIKDLIENESYYQLTLAVNQFLKNLKHSSLIIIQTPRKIRYDFRQQIRHKIQQNFPVSLPIFQVNRDLIGGIRLFLNGELRDYSWISKIEAISRK